MRPSKTYIPIIEWIAKRGGKPFAVWEASEELLISRATVRRLFDKLKEMGYIGRRKMAYANRYWEATSQWPEDFNDAVQNYEITMAFKTHLGDIS